MSQVETDERLELSVETPRWLAGKGREYLSTVSPAILRALRSGNATAVVGGLSVLRGIRSLLAGQRMKGMRRIVLGTAFIGMGIAQRRSRRSATKAEVDESDVVDTGPDLESVADATEERATGGVEDTKTDLDASDVVDPEFDVEDVAHEVDDTEQASGEAASDVANSSPVIENVDDLVADDDDEDESDSLEEGQVADTGVQKEDFDEEGVESDEMGESEDV